MREDAGESEAFTCVRQIGEYMTTRVKRTHSDRIPLGSIAPFPLRCARKTARLYPSRSMKAAAGSGDGADRRARLGGGRPLRSLRFSAVLLRACARSGVSLIKASRGASRGRPRVCDVLPRPLPPPPPPLEPDWTRSGAASSESNRTLGFLQDSRPPPLPPPPPHSASGLLFIRENCGDSPQPSNFLSNSNANNA